MYLENLKAFALNIYYSKQEAVEYNYSICTFINLHHLDISLVLPVLRVRGSYIFHMKLSVQSKETPGWDVIIVAGIAF